jgi:NADH-quinone oxidoreductase subunit L
VVHGFFEGAIFVRDAIIGAEHYPFSAANYHGVWGFLWHGFTQPPVWLAFAGFATAYYLYLYQAEAEWPKHIAEKLHPLHNLLTNKYYFDELYNALFAGGAREIGKGLWRHGDVTLIDKGMVEGSANMVSAFSNVVRRLQTGFLYHYAFIMIIGLALLLGGFVLYT